MYFRSFSSLGQPVSGIGPTRLRQQRPGPRGVLDHQATSTAAESPPVVTGSPKMAPAVVGGEMRSPNHHQERWMSPRTCQAPTASLRNRLRRQLTEPDTANGLS